MVKLIQWIFILTVGGGILVVTIGGGSFLLIDQVPQVIEGWRSTAWPSTKATVEHAAAIWKYAEKNSSRASKATHVVELRYAFEVDGRRYTGTRRSLDEEEKILMSDHAQHVVAQFPRGRVLTVHYDPGDPSRSLIEPGVPTGGVLLSLCGIGLFAMGCLPFVLVVRSRMGRGPPAAAA